MKGYKSRIKALEVYLEPPEQTHRILIYGQDPKTWGRVKGHRATRFFDGNNEDIATRQKNEEFEDFLERGFSLAWENAINPAEVLFCFVNGTE